MERFLRRLAIALIPFCGIGFLAFLMWSLREVFRQYGPWLFVLAVACVVVTCLGVASLFDDRQSPRR